MSPQYHCKFDDLFDTLKPSAGNLRPLSSWQTKAGFSESESDDRLAMGELHSDPLDSTGTPYSRATLETGNEQNNNQSDQDGNINPRPVEDERLTQDDEATESLSETQLETGEPYEDELAQRIVTRSGRLVRLPNQLLDFTLSVPWDVLHDAEYDIQDEMLDPIAFHSFAMAASSNPDILYLSQARKARDWKQFEEAMAKEVQLHEQMAHWELVRRDALPEGTQILPAVWAFRRKRRIAMQEVSEQLLKFLVVVVGSGSVYIRERYSRN